MYQAAASNSVPCNCVIREPSFRSQRDWNLRPLDQSRVIFHSSSFQNLVFRGTTSYSFTMGLFINRWTPSVPFGTGRDEPCYQACTLGHCTMVSKVNRTLPTECHCSWVWLGYGKFVFRKVKFPFGVSERQRVAIRIALVSVKLVLLSNIHP